jgi:hypothetical protein
MHKQRDLSTSSEVAGERIKDRTLLYFIKKAKGFGFTQEIVLVLRSLLHTPYDKMKLERDRKERHSYSSQA